MHSRPLFAYVLISGAISGLSGCQAWPAANYPMQNATRVPPPGTGTYQLPSGYYNNTSSLVPAGQSQQFSDTRRLGVATPSSPSTSFTANSSLADRPASGPVVTASHADYGDESIPTFYVGQGDSDSRSIAGASGPSPSVTSELPSLRWQP
jgi:hypothetical protein